MFRVKKAIITIIKVLFFFIGWAVLISLVDFNINNPALWRFFAELIPFALIVVFTIVFLLVEKGQVRIPVWDNMGKGTVTGLAVGIFWIGLSVGILFLLHQLTIDGKSTVIALWLWIISAFINVIMQELLVRGYIYQLLKEKYNLPLAVIITTAIFTVLHGGAFEAGIIPVINIITMSLFVTALYESEKTILAPIMAHAVWNIVGAIILGGVSLADDYPSIFTLVPSSNVFLSGGGYKIEASVIVTFMNIALTVIFYIKYKRTRGDIKDRLKN